MALFRLNLPALAEAMIDYNRFMDGQVQTDFKRVVTYHFNAGEYKVHIAGTLYFCEVATSRLQGRGTVSLTRVDESFIYDGQWHDGLIAVESLASTLCSISGKTLVYHEGPVDLSFNVEANEEGRLQMVGQTHVKVIDSHIEFPVVPGQYPRLCASDGEYVTLNFDGALYAQKAFAEISGMKIYRIGRDFGALDREGRLVKGQLILSQENQLISWWLAATCSQVETDLSGGTNKEKILTWLTGTESVFAREKRGLLRILDIEVPYMVGPNGSPTQGSSSAAAC